MYAIPGAGFMCPVASLKQFISKTHPDASSLFNCCSKSALKDPTEVIWYTSTPIKHYQFTRFIADISKHSRCSKTYTAHSLRSTAIQGMNDSGHKIRHIMHMSGHKNEASVRSYNRGCSMAQKQSLSSSLSSLLIPQSDVISLP
jgi:hypothetical protein